MNIDTLAGEGTDLKGRVKENIGAATGDSALRSEGVSDQLAGNARKAFGSLRDFVRDQPLIAAAVGAVIAFAVLGGLRGSDRRQS
jgi:uncharacterized protein YjbJ (UPF0337 family)